MQTDRVRVGSAVMLHSSCREGRMSHNTAYRAADGRWYVRKGKRGTVVRYLTQCEVTYLDGVPSIYQFKTDYLEELREFEAKLEVRRANAALGQTV